MLDSPIFDRNYVVYAGKFKSGSNNNNNNSSPYRDRENKIKKKRW